MAEKYRLSWLQSPSDFANEQEVHALIAGAPTVIVTNQLMLVSFVEYIFPTDAAIEWWVTTVDQTGAKKADSPHDSFVAANLATLVPASALSHTWISHEI